MGTALDNLYASLSNGSSHRPFGFEKRDLKGIQYTSGYCCPKCGHEPPEEESYSFNGEKYPQCCNEILYGNDEGTTHDWYEVHICTECGTKYYFRNGCF